MISKKQPIRGAQGKQATRHQNKNFREEVFKQVKKIPKGKVTTYGEIATKLGNPRLSRQVGWALHQNKSADVPCHRVVDRNGRLAPNFGGPSLESFGRRAFSSRGRPAFGWDGASEQKRRLAVEGVKFVDEMHVNLNTSLWQK
ncbi:MAG: MGMT family protein [Patescibacteria group bacterium]